MSIIGPVGPEKKLLGDPKKCSFFLGLESALYTSGNISLGIIIESI